MTADIEGRVAIVGGSSSGLGFAVAEKLAANGARVVVVSRSAERVSAAVDALRELGSGAAEGCVADFTDPDAPRRVVARTIEVFGPPEIVIANGGGPPGMPATSATAGDLTSACELLLLPVQRLAGLTLPAMRSAGWGRFVAITSVAVRQPQPGLVLSNALRAAVTGYLKSLADEVAADGVTVNTVCPGYTATDRLGVLARNVAERAGNLGRPGLRQAGPEWPPSAGSCGRKRWPPQSLSCAPTGPLASPASPSRSTEDFRGACSETSISCRPRHEIEHGHLM